jgi:hypothetical protein
VIPTCHANKVLLKVAHAFLYMDGLLSVAQTVPKPFAILPSIFPTFNCTSKTTGWFTKGQVIPTCPTLTKCYSGARILIYMDFFSRTKLCPSRCYLTFFERSVALVKRLAGSQGAEIDPTCLTKCYSKVRILIYGWTSFSRQTVPAVAILPSSMNTFNCTGKTLVHQKG